MYSDKHFVTEMLKAGASGYLLKHCAFEELSHAIQVVVNNRSYLSPEITGIVLKDLFHNNDKGSKVDKKVNNPLTGREREICSSLQREKPLRKQLQIST